MKVLIVPEYAPSGGALSFFKRLLEIHIQNDIETAVLLEKQQQIPDVITTCQRHQVKVYTGAVRNRLCKFQVFSLPFDIFYSWRAFRSFRPDLIVVSNCTLGFLVGVLLFPVPVLFMIHSYPQARMSIPLRAYLHVVTRMRNRFVTVSKLAAGNLNRWVGIPMEKIEVIYNSFPPERLAVRDRSPVVLTAGHVESYKNPECWLEVAQQVLALRPDVRFVWLGDGDLLEFMRQKVQGLNLGDRISFCGYCDKVETYYVNAQIYFQPSLAESHGIAVVEAMSYGLPCVTSDAGGLPESVINGETGFTCAPDDVEGFVAKIIELIGNADLREKLGVAGKNRAERLFSEAVQEEKILGLYSRML